MSALPLPPGPRGHWLFGELKERATAPLRLYERLRDDHGDIVHFRVAWRKVVAVFSPEAIKHVLVDNNANYSKGALAREADGLLGKGLLTSDGELWKRQRRLMQPAFHKERIAALSAQVVECLEALSARWEALLSRESEPSIDVAHEMTQLTLQVVGKTLFGKDVSGQSDEMGRAMAAAVEEENRRILDPLHLPMALPTPNNRRRKRALDAIDRVVFELINARREGRTRGDDLLQLLVDARDADTGEGMDTRQLRDEVLTLLLAGHETTANALSWTWHLLAAHPEVEAALQTELATVLAGRAPVFSDLPRLRYAAQVLEESMRLYPPAWLFIREALADDAIGGYRIPRGHIAAICTWAVHRHPKLWEEPLRFDPDRFSPERSAKRPRYAYVPFGGGQRICIGQQFAMMEATLALATLAQRFSLRAVEGHPVEPHPQVTLRPKQGIAMRLSRRPASLPIPPGPRPRPGETSELR